MAEKLIQNSVVYVSLGSLESIDKKEQGEIAWGLANSKQPFLWVIRPGSVDDLEWNKLLAEDITEVIGVPMICQPCFSDQRVMQGMLVEYRKLVYTWRIRDRRQIEKTIKRLMVDEEGKEMRQRAKYLKERVELSIRAGSSYNSLNDLVELIRSF
ncbi:hypothetical protein V6N13_072977 [Hibiscus sabdariffa]|uniref:Uncharacterized protein n=1 Tax=Hibiscus sabdariffa TaxID=183260 RepID=A0ABR2E9R2_9ROSI